MLYFLLGSSIGISIIYIISNKEILYKIIHYNLLIYSYVCIASIKYYKQLPLTHFNNVIRQVKNILLHEIEVIKDNDVIIRCKIENLIMYNPLYMDFFIYSDIHSSPINKVVSKDIYNLNPEYEICDFKLHLVQVILSSTEKYLIELSNTTMNYLIVNNVIDKYLVCYLLYKQYGLHYYEDSIEYTLEFMDQNMDIIIVTEKDEIHLNKTSYTIKNIHNVPLQQEYIHIMDDGSKVTENMYFRSSCNE